MTDDEELHRAVNQAEAAVQGLEAQVASAAALRHALSQESLDALEARKAQLAQVLRSLTEEEQAVNAGLARLEQQLRKPGFQVPPKVATPLTWFLRSIVFMVYGGSVVASYRFIQSPGLVVALVAGLPIAFGLVMVAGSLRESGAADTAGGRAGPGDDRSAHLGAERPGTRDGSSG